MVGTQRVAVVTGGAHGIGAATAAAFVAEGARVAIVDRDVVSAQALARSLDPSERRVRSFGVDVALTESVNEMMASVVDAFGRIDTLTNIAGVVRPCTSSEVTDDDWNALVNIHLGGTFRCCRSAFPYLRESRGSVVNTASIAAQLGFSQRASYCASKAAILGLTRCLAVEWAPFGIRMNAVAPGHTQTQLVDHAIASGVLPADRLAARIGRIPMARMGTPAEIANVIVFLSSERASYVSGETVTVDGAFSVSADELPSTT